MNIGGIGFTKLTKIMLTNIFNSIFFHSSEYLMNDNNWRLTEDENNNETKSGGGILDFLF